MKYFLQCDKAKTDTSRNVMKLEEKKSEGNENSGAG